MSFSLFFIGDGHHDRLRDEDDALLQFAIQQSLMEAGTEADQVVLSYGVHLTIFAMV